MTSANVLRVLMGVLYLISFVIIGELDGWWECLGLFFMLWANNIDGKLNRDREQDKKARGGI